MRFCRQVDDLKAAGDAEAVRLDLAGGEGRLRVIMTLPDAGMKETDKNEEDKGIDS